MHRLQASAPAAAALAAAAILTDETADPYAYFWCQDKEKTQKNWKKIHSFNVFHGVIVEREEEKVITSSISHVIISAADAVLKKRKSKILEGTKGKEIGVAYI